METSREGKLWDPYFHFITGEFVSLHWKEKYKCASSFEFALCFL